MAVTDLVGTAKNPIPSGAHPGVFKTRDGVEIRYAHWPHSGPQSRGTVCLFSGRTEYIEKYFEVIADMRRRGFAVAVMDWRGQGGSARLTRNPLKGHVRDFADYDVDLADFMKKVVLPDCPPPYYALAHSLGAHILLRNATIRGSWFDRMVLVAPMIKLAPKSLPFTQKSVCRGMEFAASIGLGRSYVPGGRDDVWSQFKFDGNPLTSDQYRFERNLGVMKAAPQLRLGSPTIGWLRAACQSMNLLNSNEFPASVQVPILLVGAGSDAITSTRAMEELAVSLKVGSHIILAGSRHEVLQERDEIREQFWAAFDAYLPDQTKAAFQA